jgi:hypothetical protein
MWTTGRLLCQRGRVHDNKMEHPCPSELRVSLQQLDAYLNAGFVILCIFWRSLSSNKPANSTTL